MIGLWFLFRIIFGICRAVLVLFLMGCIACIQLAVWVYQASARAIASRR